GAAAESGHPSPRSHFRPAERGNRRRKDYTVTRHRRKAQALSEPTRAMSTGAHDDPTIGKHRDRNLVRACAGTVSGLIPWLISHWRMQDAGPAFAPVRAIGVLIVAAGVVVVLDAFARFAIEGMGTPAPILPTRQL